MCDADKIATMNAFYARQLADYKAELAHCQQTIKDKVKGQIRKAQRRANELKENIHTNKALSEPYRNNGGIW
jgi:hypothetical protein